MEKISVVIITYNEEKNIARCIESVQTVADEIIVLDSQSTDRTVAIAESKGAVVKQEVFQGYIQQKDKAVEMAKFDYVLSLDADEALDPVLAESILQTKQKLSFVAYRMNRCTNYCGKFIRHGSWYPDVKIRLFDRREAHWGGTNPHDKIVLTNRTKTKHLKGDILHYTYNTISEHVAQNNKFSTIAAESLFAKGKKRIFLKFFSILFGLFFRAILFGEAFWTGCLAL